MTLDIQRIIETIEKVLKKAKRNLELKGAPLIIFESGYEVIWILENGEVCVSTWDGEEWVEADDKLALDTLKMALFEYALNANYDALVRGKKE